MPDVYSNGDTVIVEETESILEIISAEDNRLHIRLKDGTEQDRVWQDRSRVDSWTPVMREAARIKAKEGGKRCQSGM